MSQSPTEIHELLERHGLRPRKRLGQHFLADANIVQRIIDLAEIDATTSVLEIGAGTGVLTRALAERGHHVLAYEVDDGLKPLLQEVLAGVDVDLRFEDAAGVDFSNELDGAWVLVANLPYNVGTPIVLDLMRHVPAVARFCVMVQKEVADRLTASPGSRVFGLPSVVAGLYTQRSSTFTVPPQVFIPPPKVGSAVVRFDRREAPAEAERAISLASVAFNQRRKMLRQSLRDALPEAERVLTSAGIDPTRRPETLTVEEWVTLAEAAA